jgi:hypothetical protein
MVAKIGFVLLFVVLGVLVMVMLFFLPGDARGRLPGIEESLQSDETPSTSVREPAATQAPRQEVPMSPPVAVSARGRYTLQLGLFPDRADAEALAAQVEALQLPRITARALALRDAAGQVSWVTVAGDQDKAEALESARAWLAEHFSLSETRIIAMPATNP